MNSEHQANLPERIQPVYRTERVNEPIPLLSGRVEVVVGEERATGEGEMYLDWLPHPRLGVWVYPDKEFAGIWYPAWTTDRWRVEFSEWDVFMQVAPTVSCWNPRPDTHDVISAVVAEPFTVGAMQELDYAILHLVNFHECWGIALRDGGQRMEWLTPAWRITVDQLPEFAELKKQLCGGGYAITHAVKVERADGKPFSSEALQELLEPLGLFFSFLRGAWGAPVLAVGFDGRGNRRWQMWTAPDLSKIHSGSSPTNWFPEQSRDITPQIASMFTRLLELWRDGEWRKALRLSIGWYAEASGTRRLVEGRLVSTQIALELLSWRIIVEDGQLETEESFKKGIFQKAKAKIRRLLRWANVPDNIPSECSYLSQHAAQKGWSRGTQAITKLRNIIVHASKESRDEYYNTGTLVLWDASQLALLYLELVLLRLLGYEGVYRNRLKHRWVGEVEPVPWARGGMQQEATAHRQDG